jgi:hypothetical protein
MKIAALQAIPAPILIAAGLVAPPLAGAYPTGPCARSDIGTVVQDVNAYTLCTGVGWVHVSGPVKQDPSGECADLGTVGPNNDATYTICTTLGWVDVDRSVCADFPGLFTLQCQALTANPISPVGFPV